MKILIGLFLLSTLCFAQPKVKVLFVSTSFDVRMSSSANTINERINKFIVENNAKVLNVDLEKVAEDYYMVTIVYEDK